MKKDLKYTSFIIKFLFFSTLLYLLWIPFASAYFSAILKITAAYFELIGIEITLNPAQDYLYSQGIRSCIPPFIALILSTNLSFEWLRRSIASQCEKKALPKKKTQKIFSKPFCLQIGFPSTLFLKGLIIGIPVLFFFRVILQISYVYLQIPPPPGEFYSIFVIFLSGTCRVALPFLLWISLTYKQIFPLLKPEKYNKGKRGGDKRGYICPFCGAEKVGILDHIRNAHGEEYLKSDKVKQLLEQNPQITNLQVKSCEGDYA